MAVIDIKFGFGALKLDLGKFVKDRRAEKHPVITTAKRFTQIFEDHGIRITQVPRFLPQLSLEMLKSAESLLPVLNDELLTATASLFGIRRGWLEGDDAEIYETFSCYKAPEKFFDELAHCDRKDVMFPVAVLCGCAALDLRKSREQPLALVMLERIPFVGNREVFRYSIGSDLWDWSHPPARIQLKAMARLTYQSGVTTSLHFVRSKDVEAVRSGHAVPRRLLEGWKPSNLELEDFALSDDESRRAQEVEELPYVLEYLEKQNLPAPSQRATLRDACRTGQPL